MFHKFGKALRSKKESRQPTTSPLISAPCGSHSLPAAQPQVTTHLSQGTDGLTVTAPNFKGPSLTIGEGQNYGVRVLFDSGNSACVDIVFVHGLTGDAYNTWLHKETGIHWPSKLLGQDIPDSRILSFGYDADVVNILGGGPASNSRLSNHAESLVGKLVRARERSETETRKIIFVAHSLGGLVTEQALTHSKNSAEPHLKQVERYTIGIVFLGVPHCGSDLEAWATVGRRMVSIIKRTNKDILSVLNPDSEMLHVVENSFHTTLRQRKYDPIEIVSFYEELALKGIGEIVPQRSAKIAGYNLYGIHADHIGMTKFPSREDPGYDAILGELQRWIKASRQARQDTSHSGLVVREATIGPTSKSPQTHQLLSSIELPGSSQDQREAKLSTQEYSCLQSLWPSGIDYESQKNQNPRRVPNTCLWTLQNPKYLEWRDNNTKKLLWISADPGCGKSVLTRCIVDEDLPSAFQNDSSKRVLYYFFKDTSLEQRSASRAISTILHQLFVSHPQLIRYAVPKYNEMGAALSTTFPELWSIFTAAAVDPTAGDIICVLDALDECNDQEQSRLIECLEDFCLRQRKSSSASRLRFLITSRPYFEIRRRFDRLLEASNNIELAGNDESASIKKEIDLVIKHQVANLKREIRLAQKVSDHLETRLLETEHRTYLWLHLLWNIIRKNLSGTKSEMDRLIDNLPDDIQGSYEVLLQKCPDPVFAKKVLQIVLVAARPLTLREIDVALNVNEQTSSYADLEEEGPSRLRETLPSRCGLMVSIIQSKVYFIHQTVKEFLLGKVGSERPAGRVWQQSLELRESHHLLAKICLRSISFSEVELHQASLCNALLPEEVREMEPSAYCWNHVFLSYSAVYWADHFRDQKSNEDIKTVEHFLENSNCRSVLDRTSLDCGTILHAASLGGHEKVMQMLLDKGADVNAQGGCYGNALQAASYGGHDKVVQILLDKGADVNAQGGHYGNALQVASDRGHEKVVQILLDKGANINAQGGRYGNALQMASYEGHDKVVQILLDKGADINAQGELNGNALQMASERGHDKVIQILLDKGADVNAQGGHYGNALQVASLEGHDKVIQILLDKGADVNAQDGCYGNALQAASLKGHDKVMQILLDKGADVNAQGGLYSNALQAASMSGCDKVVQMLLNKGADVNAQTKYIGDSALQAASERGYDKVVQMLLNKGADVNAQIKYNGSSALQAASERGHDKVVQILLDKGADVNAQGGNFGKALQTASRGGHDKVVQMLLDKGADVNAQGRNFDNALQAASRGGHDKVVQMLLDKGADVNALDGYYGNALQAASFEGHEKVVQMLLNHHAVVN